MIEPNSEVDADIDVFEQSESVQAIEHSQHWISLPDSTMLSVEEVDKLLRWREASIIAVVGERNGGKTTLVTEIYERFLRGSFADVIFCHSLSLFGFEKKNFQSRAESGAATPDTPRTSAQDGLRFFHLALSNESDLQRNDLLISERAGEVYREIRDRPERSSEMIEIRKAKAVAFIIDGERVAAPRKRAEVFASVRNIIRALVDTDNISEQAQIQLVSTKFDLLDGDSMSDARNSLSDFEETISTMLAGRFEVVIFRTAARNPKRGTEPAYGLAPLLKSWLKPKNSVVVDSLKLPELSDEFDRFLLRRHTQ
ncbi:TPA: hypothetical protein SLN67_004419 [Serratia marcescens]|nr:hypothetical protein [Serratia marcescens]